MLRTREVESKKKREGEDSEDGDGSSEDGWESMLYRYLTPTRLKGEEGLRTNPRIWEMIGF